MARRRRDQPEDAGSLFGDTAADRALDRVPPAPSDPARRSLGTALPEHVLLGTSSWAYPGWRGIVFAPRAPAALLARDGLAAYASVPLFRTVGLDRAFYSTPSVEEYSGLAELVPPAFRFTVKADQRCTRPDMSPDGSTLGSTTALRASGSANPRFLDPAFIADEVIGPAITGLGERLGPVVLQFPHLDLSAHGRLGGTDAFLQRLGSCLRSTRERLGDASRPTLAVEVRNREPFQARHVRAYADALAAGGAVHVHLQHPTVPAIPVQQEALAAAAVPAAGAVVVRWMLPAGSTYEAAASALEPYDRIQAPDAPVRAEIAALLQACSPARPGFVVINNKAEGCAALSVEALAREVVAGRQGYDALSPRSAPA